MKNIQPIILAFLFNCVLFSQTAEEDPVFHLNRAYASICDEEYYSVNHWLLGESTADMGESGYKYEDYDNLMLFKSDACSRIYEGYWRRLYDIIANSNIVINSADNPDNTARMIAEAKFIRSLAYFDLVKVFGAVPLYTEKMDWLYQEYSYGHPEFVFKQRSAISDIYSQLKIDLNAAATDLPVKSSLASDELYRVTSNAAKALLAKVYLYESSYASNYPDDSRYSGLTVNWDMVLSLSAEVISNGEYALLGGMTYDTWWNDSYAYPDQSSAFRYLFSVEGNYSSESIFEAKRHNPENGWTFFGDNGITQFTAVRQYDEGGSVRDFGWGHNTPTQLLENAYAAETDDPTDDPRFQATVSKSGDSVLASDNKWYEISFDNIPTDRQTRKYECSPDQYWNSNNGWGTSPFNIRIIRLADVYLWAAEAAYQLSNNAEALAYINTVRARTAASGSSGYPQTLSTLSFDDIVHERTLELAMEGHRFFDLVRWGRAEDVLNGLYNYSFDQNITFTAGTNEVFPIPSQVVRESEGVVTQNPGYYQVCPFLNSFEELHIKPDVDSTVIDLTEKYSGSTLNQAVLTASVSNSPDASVSVDLENNKLTVYYHAIEDGDTTTVFLALEDPVANYNEEFNIIAIEPDIPFTDSEISQYDQGFSHTYYTKLFFSESAVSITNLQAKVFLPDGNRFTAMRANSYANGDNSDYGMYLSSNKYNFLEFAEKTLLDTVGLLVVFWDMDTWEKHSFHFQVSITDVIRTLTVRNEVFSGDTMTINIASTELTVNDSTYSEPRVLHPDINRFYIELDIDTAKVKFLGISSEGTISSEVDHHLSTQFKNDTIYTISDSLSGYIYGEGELVQLKFQIISDSVDNTIVSNFGFIRYNSDYKFWETDVIVTYEVDDDEEGETDERDGDEEPDDGQEGDETTDIKYTSTQKSSLLVFPTYASNFIQIKTELERYTIQVFDLRGKLYLEEHTENMNEVLNIETLPQGLYILRINNSESVTSAKFIKQ